MTVPGVEQDEFNYPRVEFICLKAATMGKQQVINLLARRCMPLGHPQQYGMQGTPWVQFANIRKTVLCQDLLHCLQLLVIRMVRHAQSL